MNIVHCNQLDLKGGAKTQNGRFPSKIALQSATKFLCVNTISDKVVRHSLAYLSVQNGSRETSTSAWKFGRKWPTQPTSCQSFCAVL